MSSQVKYGLKTKVITMERFVGPEKRGNMIEYVASQTYGLNVSSTTQISALPSTSRIKLSAISDEPEDMSGKIIGLSIGLPIGIFCFGLMIFLIYFYFIKNSIFLSIQAVSPKESIKGSEDTWFNRLFNFDCFHKSNNTDDIEKNSGINSFGWSNNHAMESTIQYKIGINPCNSKGYEHFHIRTPKEIHKKYPRIKPQPLEKISSLNFSETRLSFASDASTNVENGSKGINDDYGHTYYDGSIYKKNKGKENFTSKLVSSSPLDRRTYRSSVYQRINDLIPRLTPTIQLKNLKILNRLDKNYAEQPVGYENERSPILDKSHHVNPEDVDVYNTPNLYTESCGLPSLVNSTISKEAQMESRYSSINHLIKRQVLDNNKTDRKLNIIIEPVPFKTKTSKKPKIEILPHENEVHVKPDHLFLDKEKSEEENKHHSKLTVGRVYPVIRPYIPQLTDEISLSIGEYVRVLVVHDDDKWCLVEKCTMDGTSKSIINFGDQMRNNRKYLNDDRGIIPGECILKEDSV